MTTRLLTFDECEALGLDGTNRDGQGPWYVTDDLDPDQIIGECNTCPKQIKMDSRHVVMPGGILYCLDPCSPDVHFAGGSPCPSGDTDCTVDCGRCKGGTR